VSPEYQYLRLTVGQKNPRTESKTRWSITRKLLIYKKVELRIFRGKYGIQNLNGFRATVINVFLYRCTVHFEDSLNTYQQMH
jgi:hypothetical protein